MNSSSNLFLINGLFRILSSFIPPTPPLPPTPAKFYKIDATAGKGGKVTASARYVKEGGNVTLSARPDYGYKFLKWDDDETDNPRTITNIQDNITLAAVFKEKVPPTPSTEPDYLCFTANKAGATLRMTGMYTENYTGDDFALEYSTDGETWQDWNITKNDIGIGMVSAATDTLTFTSIGDKVYLRGDNARGTGTITISSGDAGYLFTFAGGEGTQPNDNVFAVTGDLQTLKDKTGQDKVAAEFAGLFLDLSGEEPTMLITSAPDLTATTLIDNCYAVMFFGQILLASPAAMPLFTFADLPANNTGMEVSGCFGMMYAGSGIPTPANFNNVEISGTLSQDEALKVFNFYYMYAGVSEINSNFVITNDNGASLIGFDGIEFPIVFVDSPHDGYYFAAEILGIEEGAGFDMVYLYSEPNDNDYGSTHCNHIGSDHGSMWLPTNGYVEIEVVAYPNAGYQFVKWQSSSDGETWTDIPGATSSTYTATLTQAGDYYYKAIFEQTNP